MSSGTGPMSPLLEALDAQALALAEAGCEPIAAGRVAARQVARSLGLPTSRMERWKHTALRGLSARRFAAPASHAPDGIDPGALAGIPAPRLVIANGRYAPALSDLQGLAEGLRLRLLSEVLRDAPDEAARWLASAPGQDDAAFQHWNDALAEEGFILEVEPGVQVESPLQLVVLGVADGMDRAFHLRHRIVLGAGAVLTVAQHHLGCGAHRHLLNTVLQVELGDGANLTQLRMQREADGATLLQRTRVRLAAAAHYRRLDLELGAALSRHELEVILAGDGAVLESNGVLLADGRRHHDTRLDIQHRARDSRCTLLWRGLGSERGRVVFHGGILIAAGADGTNASLSNKNLLLSDTAEIDTQPVLVIHADDVKAAHGATVGRLDEAALFYLRARGIPAAEATALLTAAFLREPLALLDATPLARYLSTLPDARLGGDANPASP